MGLLVSLLGARTLLGAPGLTTRNKDATSSKKLVGQGGGGTWLPSIHPPQGSPLLLGFQDPPTRGIPTWGSSDVLHMRRKCCKGRKMVETQLGCGNGNGYVFGGL